MDLVELEVQEFDLSSVKSEEEECKFLYLDEEADSTENLPDNKRKLSIASNILNCLLQCRQIFHIISDSDCQLTPRLVECPFCPWECKNCPDRLLQLLDHAREIHNASLETTAQFILERYQPLMRFMMNEYLKLF